MSNERKVAVVTGAAGGIGSAVVKKFYKNDYDVVMVDVTEEGIKKVIADNNFPEDRVSWYVMDISDEEQVKNNLADVKAKKGRIDALVNTAGIVGKYNPTIDYSFENFKRIYEVNVFGTFLMMKYALPTMVEQNYGRIVNFGSVSGMTGYTFEIGYGSSKWAVIGMTKNVANEYGPHNGARMPDYHRLDLSTTYILHKGKRVEGSLNLSVYNVYARQNPLYLDIMVKYNEENNNIGVNLVGRSLYSILPSLGYSLKF